MFFDIKMLFPMILKPIAVTALLVGILVALLVCCCSLDWADKDERICLDVSLQIASPNPDMDHRRLALVAYEGCIEERHDAAQNTRDSLEAEYLEKLQTCNERAQEAYDNWMACTYPNLVELEEQAHTYNDQRGEKDACDMREVRGVSDEGRSR